MKYIVNYLEENKESSEVVIIAAKGYEGDGTIPVVNNSTMAIVTTIIDDKITLKELLDSKISKEFSNDSKVSEIKIDDIELDGIDEDVYKLVLISKIISLEDSDRGLMINGLYSRYSNGSLNSIDLVNRLNKIINDDNITNTVNTNNKDGNDTNNSDNDNNGDNTDAGKDSNNNNLSDLDRAMAEYNKSAQELIESTKRTGGGCGGVSSVMDDVVAATTIGITAIAVGVVAYLGYQYFFGSDDSDTIIVG